VSAYKK